MKHCLTAAKQSLLHPTSKDFSPTFSVVVSVLTSLKPKISSAKTLAVLLKFYTEEKEGLKQLQQQQQGLGPRATRLLLEFNYSLLSVLVGTEPKVRKDLLNLVLVPAIQFVADNIKGAAENVKGAAENIKVAAESSKGAAENVKGTEDLRRVCEVAAETVAEQTSTAVEMYLKKNKEKWSAFIKGRVYTCHGGFHIYIVL